MPFCHIQLLTAGERGASARALGAWSFWYRQLVRFHSCLLKCQRNETYQAFVDGQHYAVCGPYGGPMTVATAFFCCNLFNLVTFDEMFLLSCYARRSSAPALLAFFSSYPPYNSAERQNLQVHDREFCIANCAIPK